MELRELIRDTLREKMESQYKTLTAFAKASGVSQSYLSKIFGEVAVDISPTILSKLLSPLGVSLSQFFTDVEKKRAVLNIRLSEAELQQLMDMIPNGKEKQGFLAKLRETIPELPAWLKYENQVQAARERLENDLIPGIAGSQQEWKPLLIAAGAMLPVYLLSGMIAPTPFWWAVSLLIWTGAGACVLAGKGPR